MDAGQGSCSWPRARCSCARALGPGFGRRVAFHTSICARAAAAPALAGCCLGLGSGLGHGPGSDFFCAIMTRQQCAGVPAAQQPKLGYVRASSVSSWSSVGLKCLLQRRGTGQQTSSELSAGAPALCRRVLLRACGGGRGWTREGVGNPGQRMLCLCWAVLSGGRQLAHAALHIVCSLFAMLASVLRSQTSGRITRQGRQEGRSGASPGALAAQDTCLSLRRCQQRQRSVFRACYFPC